MKKCDGHEAAWGRPKEMVEGEGVNGLQNR